MKDTEAIITRQKYHTRFRNEDMDFIFTWFLGVSVLYGMSPSQAFLAVTGCRDGSPSDWRRGFLRQARWLTDTARTSAAAGELMLAGQAALGSATAFRAALQYVDPSAADFTALVEEMEGQFQAGARFLGIPVRPIEVPFEGKTLAGYLLQHDARRRPLLVMVGGGDSYREDLFAFAGYPGWKRGYNVLMVDLPGQGKMPARGFTFRPDMGGAVTTVIDWAEANLGPCLGKTAVYGVSGGGYISAQAAARDSRIEAWVASTPLWDLARVMRREFAAALRAPRWLVRTALRAARRANEGADINLRKYAWQFGTEDFAGAVEGICAQAAPVDLRSIRCPSLFLVGESEAEDLKRQADEARDIMTGSGTEVTLRVFTAQEGGDAHCQVNNFRAAHVVVFDWLDRVLDYRPPEGERDKRLLC